MEMPLISIIVPVFNSEKYIKRCIESLLEQTYANIEIIIVNDGSNDRSEIICQNLLKKNSHIHYFFQENKGVSSARNKGLLHAKGEYVLFVDSDDYVEKTYVEGLHHSIINVDMAVCGYKRLERNGELPIEVTTKYSNKCYKASDFFEWLFSFEDMMYQGYLWNKMFCMEIIDQYKMQFDEDIKYNEDRLFILQYLLKSQSIYFFDKALYVYVQNDDSAMGKIKQEFRSEMLTELVAFDKMLTIIDKEWDVQKILLAAYIAGCRMMHIADKEAKKIIYTYCVKWLKKMSHLSIKSICRIIYNTIRIIF